MNTLVTGAAGFIGSHLVKALIKNGHAVRGLLMPQENGDALSALGVEIFRGNLTKPESLKDVSKGMDIVFHLAARTLDWGTRNQFEEIMVNGTRNLLEESKDHVARFVYCSSIAAYGFGRDLSGFNEDTQRKECGIPYCDTKILAEDLVTDFCALNHIEHTIIRPANVFGPGSVWVREILDAFMRGPFPLINKGSAPGAFVYIDNLVDGMILAGQSDIAAGKTYNFNDDYQITWKEYLNTIGGLVGKQTLGSLSFGLAWGIGAFCEKVFTPLGLRPPMTRLAASVTGKNNDVDSSRARRELGWKSRISQDDAMKHIKQWVKTSYRAPGQI